MKYVIWIVLIFAAAVALSSAAHNAGYVLLVYPPYRIELSLNFFILLLLLFALASYSLIRLVIMAIKLPKQVQKFRRSNPAQQPATEQLP
ncbi:MAG: heme biosynthesis HemY N-terminal domain-containing protein [Gallionella sp.]